MKVLSHYNNLLFATCLLLLSPGIVLAAQSGWNDIPGGKVVNGQYQLKCGEGSGWQKCGEEEPKEECQGKAKNSGFYETRVDQCRIKPSRCAKRARWEGKTLYSSSYPATSIYGAIYINGRHLNIDGYTYYRGNPKKGAMLPDGFLGEICRKKQ